MVLKTQCGLLRIAIEATCFVLDDRFESLKQEWEESWMNL